MEFFQEVDVLRLLTNKNLKLKSYRVGVNQIRKLVSLQDASKRITVLIQTSSVFHFSSRKELTFDWIYSFVL